MNLDWIINCIFCREMFLTAIDYLPTQLIVIIRSIFTEKQKTILNAFNMYTVDVDKESYLTGI